LDLIVLHRCYTRPMPTKRRRHAITETPAVKEALDELRTELGTDKFPLAEVVILGAEEKVRRLRSEQDDAAASRKQVAEWIRTGNIPGDPEAADEVRRTGWTPHA
jgi:hypothetical protein